MFGGQGNDLLVASGTATATAVIGTVEMSGNLGDDDFVFNYGVATNAGTTVVAVDWNTASHLTVNDLEVGESLTFASGGVLTSITAVNDIATLADNGTDVTIKLTAAASVTAGGVLMTASTITIVLEGIGTGSIAALADISAEGYVLVFT